MKRFLAVLLLCSALLCLSACGVAEEEIFTRGDYMTQSYNRQNDCINTIVTALENNDSETLLSLFSASAVQEVPTLQDDIAVLLADFPDGELRWDNDHSSETSSSENFVTRCRNEVSVDVYCGEARFSVHFSDIYYLGVDKAPSDEGLCSLYIIEEADEQTQFITALTLRNPGVHYRPSRLYEEP